MMIIWVFAIPRKEKQKKSMRKTKVFLDLIIYMMHIIVYWHIGKNGILRRKKTDEVNEKL